MIAQVTAMASGSVSTGHSAVPQPRLVSSAHEFEAQLMKELLKPLAQSFSANGDDDDSDSAGVLGDYATESLAKALSEQGGLGIATKIIQTLTPTGNTVRQLP